MTAGLTRRWSRDLDDESRMALAVDLHREFSETVYRASWRGVTGSDAEAEEITRWFISDYKTGLKTGETGMEAYERGDARSLMAIYDRALARIDRERRGDGSSVDDSCGGMG